MEVWSIVISEMNPLSGTSGYSGLSQLAMLETPPHISILASGPPAVPDQCGKLAMNSRAQLSRPILPAGWSLFFGGFAAAVLALGLYLLSA